MSLSAYHKKRKFDKTPEPKGSLKKNKTTKLRFVVHKHDASHLHYDVRLELNGTLKSWAVPKGPSMDPKIKRLAVHVEDHPFDYRNFEGIIPEHQYGAGTVIIWDRGTYESAKPEVVGESGLMKSLKKGRLEIILHGEKLKGMFALVKTHFDKDSWLMVKMKDEYASKIDITKQDTSVKSGKTIEQIKNKKENSKNSSQDLFKIKGVKKGPIPKNISPMLATLTEKPFNSSAWLFEIKWDGYRSIGEVNGDKTKIYSRNGTPFNRHFPAIVNELSKLPHKAVVDGEIVAVDKYGKASFQLLQKYLRTQSGTLAYYIFDIIHLDGYDLKNVPLIERKNILKKIIPTNSILKYSDHIKNTGNKFFTLLKRKNLEGMMAKSTNSAYQPGIRSVDWLKIKTQQRQEAIICGFTQGRASRKYFGALILGLYDQDKLTYIGHTGTGFDKKTLHDLYEKLTASTRKTSPFKLEPKTNMPVTWVEPKLVCEVKFSEWTSEGYMRQPVYLGLRIDKSPKEIGRELPKKI